MSRAATAGAAAIVIVFALELWRLQGPAPRTVDASPRQFSAERAVALLRELMPEGIPHPVGSAANGRIRERIAGRLRQLGYPVTIQRTFVCNARPSCATVENIIAIPRGSGDVVLLAAHYDSVPAGPGVSDDGIAVAAILETARVLRSEHFRNRIGVLFTDGEEAGLLGAEAFAREPSMMRDIGVVIELENRGPSGPSFLFETSRDNQRLIHAASRALKHPLTTSLFNTVYEMMPNDTDVTVFKRAGLQTLNFASIGDVVWYHTPLDDFRHIDPRTVQHHGENALLTARELASSDLRKRANGNAVFFDVLGFSIVAWPQPWSLWIALATAGALVPVLLRARLRGLAAGIAVTAASILLSGLTGALLMLLFRSRLASPQPVIVAAALAGFTFAGALALLASRRVRREDLSHGAAIVWNALAITSAALLPGTSFLFIVPALALTLAAYVRPPAVAIVIRALVTAALLSPLVLLLYTALGPPALVAIPMLTALIATSFVFELRTFAVPSALGALAVLLVISGALLPRVTSARPSRQNISYVLDAGAGARWEIGDVRHTAPLLPVAPVAASSHGNVLEVSSPRRADALVVTLPAGVQVKSVNGVKPAPRNRRTPGQPDTRITVRSASAVIELGYLGAPLRCEVADVSWGLPPAGAALVQRRNASGGVPRDSGDVTTTRRTITLK